jgi:membrane associated rhomboid family serine protease
MTVIDSRFAVTQVERIEGVSMRPAVVPVLFGVAAAFGAWFTELAPKFDSAADRIAFASAIASIAITMLGFMLAALAVLASISHTHLVNMMRKTGHYSDLLFTLFVGAALFLLCGISGYLILFGLLPSAKAWAALAGMHVGALFALIDLGRKLWLVLKHLRPQD